MHLPLETAASVEVVQFSPEWSTPTLGCVSFYHYTALRSVRFPASLEGLPGHLFNAKGSSSRRPAPLESVSFEPGSNLREICPFAFHGCTGLRTICVPASVERLSGLSFADCRVDQIEVHPRNQFYRVFGDFLMDYNGRKIV
jgi:hypothetical protein